MTTLSDMTDANGTTLCPYASRGEKHPHRATTYTWRRQNNMDKKAWKTWCTALKATFTTDGTHLHSPLGDWSEENPPSQKWLTYKDKESLFMTPLQQGKTWTEHKLIGINKSQGLIYNTKALPASPPKRQ